MVADGVCGHGLILSAGGSGGGQHGLGTGDTSGLVGVLDGSTYCPDGGRRDQVSSRGYPRNRRLDASEWLTGWPQGVQFGRTNIYTILKPLLS